MIVLSTQIKVVSRFCESAIFNTQILFKKHAISISISICFFSPKQQSCILFARHFSQNLYIFLFILCWAPVLKVRPPPPPGFGRQPTCHRTPRLQRTGHPSSGGHESLACGCRLARGGTRGTQLWCADLGECRGGETRWLGFFL